MALRTKRNELGEGHIINLTYDQRTTTTTVRVTDNGSINPIRNLLRPVAPRTTAARQSKDAL